MHHFSARSEVMKAVIAHLHELRLEEYRQLMGDIELSEEINRADVRRSVRDAFAVLYFVLLPPSPGCLKTGAWVAFYNWSISSSLLPRLREKPHFNTYTLASSTTCMVCCWLLSQVHSSLPTDVMCIRVRWTLACEHNLLICATWQVLLRFWFG